MSDTPELAVMREAAGNSPMNIDLREDNAWAIGRCCDNGWLEPWGTPRNILGEGQNYMPTEQGKALINEMYGRR